MIKVAISILFIFGACAYGAKGFDTNMDRSVYYDADRTEQNEYERMSKELKLFISQSASEELIKQYQDGKLQENQKDVEITINQNDKNSTTQEVSKEPTWYEKALEMIGIGSTKKIDTNSTQDIAIEDINVSDDINSTQEIPSEETNSTKENIEEEIPVEINTVPDEVVPEENPEETTTQEVPDEN